MRPASPKSPSIMDLCRRAGDEHVGQTLVRLAQLAGAAQQFDTVTSITHPVSPREDQPQCGRIARKPVIVRDGAAVAGPAHKEVDR